MSAQWTDPAAEARLRLAHLRSGVPLPPTLAPWTWGRAGALTRLTDLLDTVAAKGSRAQALAANYGNGKTHTLRALWSLASQRNFVVSTVALTRETPFDRLDRAYAKLVSDTYLPGAAQPGIARLLEMPSEGPEGRSLLEWSHTALHPKLHAVLHNLLEGPRTDAAETLLRDLERMDVGVAEIKRIHRDNFKTPLKLERFSAQRDVRDYLRLLDFVIRLRGYAGWVILFDEAELVGRLGRGGRARAYANMGRLAMDGMGCAHLLTVFAVASNFYTDALLRRHDETAAPAWLESRGDAEGAEACRRGIALLQGAQLLEPLGAADWIQLLQGLLDAHERAYGWSSGLTADAFWDAVRNVTTETDTKVRVRLRLAVQWLDLMYQHGHPPHVRSIHGLQEADVSEWGTPEADVDEPASDAVAAASDDE